jgi:hypothetical protein
VWKYVQERNGELSYNIVPMPIIQLLKWSSMPSCENGRVVGHILVLRKKCKRKNK